MTKAKYLRILVEEKRSSLVNILRSVLTKFLNQRLRFIQSFKQITQFYGALFWCATTCPEFVLWKVIWHCVNREIMKLFNVLDKLTKWRKIIWNLNLHPHNQNQVPSIFKHCFVRWSIKHIINKDPGWCTNVNGKCEYVFLLIILSK
jgi:hypothetical protein